MFKKASYNQLVMMELVSLFILIGAVVLRLVFTSETNTFIIIEFMAMILYVFVMIGSDKAIRKAKRVMKDESARKSEAEANRFLMKAISAVIILGMGYCLIAKQDIRLSFDLLFIISQSIYTVAKGTYLVYDRAGIGEGYDKVEN